MSYIEKRLRFSSAFETAPLTLKPVRKEVPPSQSRKPRPLLVERLRQFARQSAMVAFPSEIEPDPGTGFSIRWRSLITCAGFSAHGLGAS